MRVWFGKWTRFLRRRTQLQGYETERSEMERWKILHSAKDLKQKRRNVKRSAYVSGSKTSQCEVLQSCEPEFNFTGCEQKRLANIHSVNIR